MARLLFPESYLAQRKLFQAIFDKDDADGSASVIRQYLEENGIVLNDDKDDGDSADAHNAAHLLLVAQAENHTQLRNLRFKPVYENMKGGLQFLKKLFGKNFAKLGNWGVHVTTTGRLIYPEDVSKQIALFVLYYQKHISFTTPPSPLTPYLTTNSIDIAADKAKADAAFDNNDKAKEKARLAEAETQDRDNLWLPVVAHMKGIGQFLMKLYDKNTKALGEWGFVVDDSPKKPKEMTTKIKLLETVTINGAIIGGTFTNLGPVDLHLYKGKTTLGTPVIVPTNGLHGIAKGFSIITVVNPNSLEGGRFKVLRSK